MDYKTFGGGRPPFGDVKSEIEALAELDSTERDALAAWLETTTDLRVGGPNLPPNISESTLLPEQFRKAASGALFLLASWQRRSLSLQDIERDLLLLGFNETQIAAVSDFLKRTESTKARAWVSSLEDAALNEGLPTLDDVNIIWNIRPVFGGWNFYYFDADADSETYDKCFALKCIATVELMVSDTNGTRERFAVQLGEDVFKMLLRAFDRADGQLRSLTNLLKLRQSDLARPRQGEK